MSTPIAATDETFQSLVIDNPKPTLVDFWAVWCGPCKFVGPEIEKLAHKYAGVIDVVKVDVDTCPKIAMQYQIMSIPTIVFFRPGVAPSAIVGARPAADIENAFGLTQHLPPATAV